MQGGVPKKRVVAGERRGEKKRDGSGWGGRKGERGEGGNGY